MVAALLRDAPFGQVMHYLSGKRLFRYPEEMPDYVVPKKYLLRDDNHSPSRDSQQTLGGSGEEERTTAGRKSVDAATLVNADSPIKRTSETDQEKRDREDGAQEKRKRAGGERDLEGDGNGEDEERRRREKEQHPGTADPKKALDEDLIDKYQYLVGFEEDDQLSPYCWSSRKRNFVAGEIALMTTVVYIGSAIYTPSEQGLAEEYGVALVVTVLGLSLFIVGYGIGPMFFSPLQETPHLGRNPVYWAAIFLFTLFQAPILKPTNLTCLLIFRFLTGFVGSPILATGGASMADLFSPRHLPYAMGVWAVGAVCGPILGPVVASFAAMNKGWRWPIYELLWMSGFGLIVFTFFLPETYAPTLLLRRAERLRKLTGNNLIKTRWELENPEGQSVLRMGTNQIKMAFRLSMEPIVLYSNVYIGLLYAVFYLWFEAFPIVFSEYHGFNLGVSTLPFLAFLVTGAMTLTAYMLYHKWYLIPKEDKNDWKLPAEERLRLALFAVPIIPVSLFIFGWTGNSPDTHWIGPTIGAALYFPGIFCAFQCILLYLQIAYPAQAASVLAGNDLFRSSMAAGFPLFGAPFFHNLGVGPACSLLAGLNILFIIPLFFLFKYGHRLRARSRYAVQ
ncbi:Benomyl/methotrexate resistance protein [Rhodotorula diobovata]|uniref:Benomyl/methotrexate resistance protein n=1 Tax=Rhodotorula diobovata TaxID=5288 RepID=A0A5C5FYI4_9BASI|nr:Benomyl/methotrexate resistance protein [Rhodotorula diobovata]